MICHWQKVQNVSHTRIILHFKVAENHFFNELKHVSSGYASMDYEDGGYRQSDLVKLEVSLNGQMVDALSSVCHRTSGKFILLVYSSALLYCVYNQNYFRSHFESPSTG
jgi:translation elongation factor EF-4